MNSDRDLSSHHKRLHEGARRFHNEVFQQNRERYEIAATVPQQPHTLFITCADSRIDPEALTQSGPGEIFVTRNIGNLVPAYGEMLGGVSAVIEYSVLALNVSQIVVCGHSDCGAMKGLLDRESVAQMPTVDRWLQNAEAALSIAKARNPDAGKYVLLPKLVEENVLLQLNHLRTHPAVAGRVAKGKLALHGWVYEIGEGLIKEFEPDLNEFLSVI